MFFFSFNDNVQVKLGASPKEADVAIVSINSGGTVGELNKIVLEEYGYDKSILKQLNLGKGFDLFQLNGKAILFVVTVGIGNPINNLNENLKQAIIFHIQKLTNKKIWIPLMATGAGKLSYAKSYEITIKILEELKNRILDFNFQFIISLPNDKKGEAFYKQIKDGFDNSISYTEHSQIDIIKNDGKIEKIIKDYINKTDSKFYLVGSNWGNLGDQSDRFYNEHIWENGYEDGQYSEIINSIKKNDIVLLKSTFAKQNKKNYLRLKAIGIVSEQPQDGVILDVNWIVKNKKIDIEGLSFYRDTITTPNLTDLEKILFNLDYNELEKIISANSIELFSPSFLNQETKPYSTTLPGLLCDSETGEDHLDIKKDVEAFARVIGAKSFTPPLAIALLGKWGSGKSFFMYKLKEDIQKLSKSNPQNAFCEGIAHVHFNAWSYMDANLWASIVTRIFETLDDYIKNTFATEKEIKNIENQLFNKLNISKEQLNNLNKQKKSIDCNIQKLQTKKDKLKSQVDRKIVSIKTKTFTDIIKKVNDEFNVRNQIENTLDDNPTFVSTSEKFKKIVPEKYWDNPTEFYNQLKSSYSFLKAFFYRESRWKNILWIIVIILILALTPVITYLINLLISWQDFTLTNGQWFTISIIGSTLVRGVDTFVKLKKQIAPFWKIKEDYESEKANALFEFEQEEKGLRLEIDNFKQEIIQIDSQIQLHKGLKATLEFKLKNALSTEALYTFIEKKANSDDYKKHLGLVSLIRKDFEILSGLLTRHQTELVTSKESQEFKELFSNKKSLERIILYIDDLDRCPEERVVEVLEAVNLLMAFPLFVVVVGVDPRWVKNALIKKHQMQFTGYIDKTENNEIEVIEASSYLDKIFQIPFHLKDADDNNIKNMIESLAKTKHNLSARIENDEQENSNTTDSINVEIVELGENDEQNITETLNIPFAPKTDKIITVEQIKALDITDEEIEQIKSLTEIIGNNPRCIKRFINIYRIIKTHEDFNYKEETKENELLIVMFFIALSIGKFNFILKSFEYFLENIIDKKSSLITYFETTYKFEIPDSLIHEKDKLHEILLRNNNSLLKQNVTLSRKHYQFIKRFTFNNI